MNRRKNFIDKHITNFEENRFGAMALMITFQSCYGSIAAMYTLKQNSILLLFICSCITMASNATFISQSPGKWCIGVFIISVFINSLILIYCI